jgi:hypothetical protein
MLGIEYFMIFLILHVVISNKVFFDFFSNSFRGTRHRGTLRSVKIGYRGFGDQYGN